MLNTTLSSFYARDIQKLADEIKAFKDEDNLWRTAGTITNPAGNLALHIVGGTSYFIGSLLANTGYVRQRDKEFADKHVRQLDLVGQLEQLADLARNTIAVLSPQQLEGPFPIPFDGGNNSTNYVLVQLLSHLNYHLGQVNYLRRMLE